MPARRPIVLTGGKHAQLPVGDFLSIDQGGTGATSASAALSALGAASLSQTGTRNRLMNASFRINQRVVSGTVTLAAGAYGHDRWKAGASGCTYTFASSGEVTVLTITAGSLLQIVEGADIGTNDYVLSWQGTAQARINTGTYGASARTALLTGGSNTTVEFSTGTVSRPQLESGLVVSLFDHRHIAVDLAMCQRYCYAFVNQEVNTYYGPAVSAFSSNRIFAVLVNCAVPMRARPTVSGSGLSIYSTAFSLVENANSFNVYSGSQQIWTLDVGTSGGLTAGTIYMPAILSGGRVVFSADL